MCCRSNTLSCAWRKPYALYNWELFYYLPIGLAVHQRPTRVLRRSRKTFHLVFDPTTRDESVAAPDRYWRFLGFRGDLGPKPSPPPTTSCSAPTPPTTGENQAAAGLPGQPTPTVPAVRRSTITPGVLPVLRRPEIPGQPDRMGGQPFQQTHHRKHSTKRPCATPRSQSCWAGGHKQILQWEPLPR